MTLWRDSELARVEIYLMTTSSNAILCEEGTAASEKNKKDKWPASVTLLFYRFKCKPETIYLLREDPRNSLLLCKIHSCAWYAAFLTIFYSTLWFKTHQETMDLYVLLLTTLEQTKFYVSVTNIPSSFLNLELIIGYFTAVWNIFIIWCISKFYQ